MSANERQVGGTHYKSGGEEHWDRVARLGLDYFQAQITKYVERCWKKNGVQDLEKARHFLDKYIELNTPPPSFTLETLDKAMDIQQQAESLAGMEAGSSTAAAFRELGVAPPSNAEFRELVESLTPWEPHSTTQFTYEGGHSVMGVLVDEYTCRACGVHFRVAANTHPQPGHQCAQPQGYVNQDVGGGRNSPHG